ncbi:MAG: endonuclease III [Patescibacteria group bacterium]
MALHFGDHWQLLVSVVLSAQTTDKKVNEVTQKLFKKYRTLEDYVRVDSRSFSRDIKEIGLYRTKAKNILAAATVVQRHYHGKLPKTMEQMIALPGVGRKSANVILGNAYGIVEGIAIDTHVRRFAIRFDLTDSTNPVVIERDLMRLLPRREWFGFTYRIIEYGRNVCPARKHPCERHPLTLLYKRAANRWYSPR